MNRTISVRTVVMAFLFCVLNSNAAEFDATLKKRRAAIAECFQSLSVEPHAVIASLVAAYAQTKEEEFQEYRRNLPKSFYEDLSKISSHQTQRAQLRSRHHRLSMS